MASSQYVVLSPWRFNLWWFILLSIHLVAFGYNASYALFYYELEDSSLYQLLEYSGVGMLAKDHPTITIVNGFLAAMHAFCVLLMVGSSLWRCELVFSPTHDKYATSASLSNSVNHKNTSTSHVESVKHRTIQLYSKVWGREGVLGVNGSNFHTILIGRELVETALQTVQAYRMSWYLPRMVLNRFYVSLLVLNCWSSVLVYCLVFRRNEARRRLVCLVCDCILDLVSCIGVPLMIVLSYVSEYNPSFKGFDRELWYDDVWSARALNEFQMVLVVSWSDLVSRSIFSCGLLVTTTGIKKLLCRAPVAGGVRVLAKGNNHKAVSPHLQEFLPPRGRSKLVAIGGSYTETGIRSPRGRVTLHAIHLMFWVWGAVVLGLYIQASTQLDIPQCVLQVHPWAVSEPACYLAVLDCHRFGITGKRQEVEDKWREFDRSTVVTLVIHHRPALEFPDMIRDFHSTNGIKLYNSSINQWGTSAALTNANHPELIWFCLVRVNFTDGVLPLGIQSADFPAKLYDLEFYDTNLYKLPDDLDSKWLPGSTVNCEYCKLTSVPEVLLRLHPYSIALTGNAITDLPPKLFEIEELTNLFIGNLPIQELPRNVTNLSPQMQLIEISDTNISFLWQWIDPMLERQQTAFGASLILSRTRYCDDLDNIANGEADTFSVMPSPEHSPLLMDPSDKRGIIHHTVLCDQAASGTSYPIGFEDSISALA